MSTTHENPGSWISGEELPFARTTIDRRKCTGETKGMSNNNVDRISNSIVISFIDPCHGYSFKQELVRTIPYIPSRSSKPSIHYFPVSHTASAPCMCWRSLQTSLQLWQPSLRDSVSGFSANGWPAFGMHREIMSMVVNDYLCIYKGEHMVDVCFIK